MTGGIGAKAGATRTRLGRLGPCLGLRLGLPRLGLLGPRLGLLGPGWGDWGHDWGRG